MVIFMIMCTNTTVTWILSYNQSNKCVEYLLHRKPCAEHCVGYNNTPDTNPTVKNFKTWKGKKLSYTNNETEQKKCEVF